jgi:glycosyltransferase involved in cell wall biosynthesis
MRVLAVTNIYPSSERPALGTFVEQQVKGLRAIGLEVDVFHVDRVGSGMRAYWGVGADARERARAANADLVHVMYGGVMAEEVTRVLRDRKCVVSFCGSDLLGERLSGWTRRFVSGIGVWASHRAARRADGIVVKSRNLLDALPAGIPAARVRILPNGVDLERFRPLDRAGCRARLGWSAAGFHVLFPANTGDRRKRPWIAHEAIERLRATGVPAELHELRGVPHASVPDWINACDAVILTSLAEGSPNIVKEALACDVAVVSVDVGDVAERIEGIGGCFISPPDPAALAARLGEVHAGGRVPGRERMSDLSIQRVAERLREFYREVLAGTTRG